MSLEVIRCPCGCVFHRDTAAEKICPSCGAFHGAGEGAAEALPATTIRSLAFFAGAVLTVLLLVLVALLLRKAPPPPAPAVTRRPPAPAAPPPPPPPPLSRPRPAPAVALAPPTPPAPTEAVARVHRLIARANLGALAETALRYSGAAEDAALLRGALEKEHRELDDLLALHPQAPNLRSLPFHVEPGDLLLAFATAALDPRQPGPFVAEIKSWFRTVQPGAAALLSIRRGDTPLTVVVHVPPLEEDLATLLRRVAALPAAVPAPPAPAPPRPLTEELRVDIRRRLDALHPRHRESLPAELTSKVEALLREGSGTDDDLRLLRNTFLDRTLRPLEEEYAAILRKSAELEAMGSDSILPDLLVFKDGRRIAVRILDETPPHLQVQVAGGRIRVPDKDLVSIERGQPALRALESRYAEGRTSIERLRALLPDTSEPRFSLIRERICRRLLVIDPLDETAWAELGFARGPATGAERARDVVVLKDGTRRTGVIVAETADALTLEASLLGSRGETVGSGRSILPRSEIVRIERMPEASRRRVLAYAEDLEERRRRRDLDLARFVLQPAAFFGVKGVSVEGSHFELFSGAPEAETRETALSLEATFSAFQKEFGVRRNLGRRIRVYFLPDRERFDAFQRASRGTVLPNPAYFSIRDNHVAAYDPVQAVEARAVRAAILQVEAEIQRYRKALDQEEDALEQQLARLRQSLPEQSAARRRLIEALPQAERPQALENLERWKERESERIRQAERGLRDFFAARRRDARKAIEANQAVLFRNRDILAAQARSLRETLVHESFHAFAANFLWSSIDNVRLPRWLHEGFASYFETGVQEGGSFFHGVPHPRHLATLRALARAGNLLPAAAVLRSGPDVFMTEHAVTPPEAAYAQAWLLAHWLASRGIDRERLDRYAQAVSEGADPAEALEKETGLGRAELDASVRLHFDRLGEAR